MMFKLEVYPTYLIHVVMMISTAAQPLILLRKPCDLSISLL